MLIEQVLNPGGIRPLHESKFRIDLWTGNEMEHIQKKSTRGMTIAGKRGIWANAHLLLYILL